MAHVYNNYLDIPQSSNAFYLPCPRSAFFGQLPWGRQRPSAERQIYDTISTDINQLYHSGSRTIALMPTCQVCDHFCTLVLHETNGGISIALKQFRLSCRDNLSTYRFINGLSRDRLVVGRRGWVKTNQKWLPTKGVYLPST